MIRVRIGRVDDELVTPGCLEQLDLFSHEFGTDERSGRTLLGALSPVGVVGAEVAVRCLLAAGAERKARCQRQYPRSALVAGSLPSKFCALTSAT